MLLPSHKTKIVCTIGPSSRDKKCVKAMMKAGMNVARLNFSHGSLEDHARDIETVRSAAAELSRPVAIIADLPGPKIRLGNLRQEPLTLRKGEHVVLEPGVFQTDPGTIPVGYDRLSESVSKGSSIYLNDGALLLKVQAIAGAQVSCTVIVGGNVSSHKGLNLPGADIFIEPVSERELQYVEFGLDHGVHVFGVSFVEKAEDLLKVKDFARSRGKDVFAIAKIERSKAIQHIGSILDAADGIMVARGDLGVEIPIEEVPVVQKRLIHRANMCSKPVITATQMLLSMTENTRPTRAEASDVANAIMDGTDALMLSEETAAGTYPVDAVRTMAKIAAVTERHRKELGSADGLASHRRMLLSEADMPDIVSRSVLEATHALNPRFILTPTRSGATARRVARFKPAPWVLSFSSSEVTASFLVLSYGVYPFTLEPEGDEDWYAAATRFLKSREIVKKGDKAILTQGRFSPAQQTTDSMAIFTFD